MQLICPQCRGACTVDDQVQDSVSCPLCGCVILTKSGQGPRHTPAETSKANDETGQLTVESPVDQLTAAALPTEWGRYRLEAVLGAGGYARVYRATDSVLGRTVALKIPRPSAFSSPGRLSRFLAEARTAAQLRHPGIVTVYDVGEFAPQAHYIAMEYIAGQSLQQRLATTRLSYEEAAGLLAKVAEAVHFAHGRGIVHRDLKPSNILLDAQGEPRVVDFGLAVHEEGQAALEGDVAGTPAYMAPEQFRGEAHHLDGRCDVWSLGVVLYETLTGRRPYKGDIAALYSQIQHREPKPPRQIDDRIPPALEAICLKCLAKPVAERYPTAKDLADELRAWRGTAATSAARPESRAVPVEIRPARSVRRLVLGTIAAVVLVATGAVLLAISPWSSRRTSTSPREPGIAERDDRPIEARTRPLVWFPLLDRKPRQLVWGGDSEVSNWNYDEVRQEVTVRSIDAAFLGLGETKSTDFRLRVAVTRSNWHGAVGLFWNYRDEVGESGGKVSRCECICLTSPVADPTDVIVERQSYDFQWIPGVLRPSVNPNPTKGVKTAVPDTPEFVIEIEVIDGILASVRVAGREFATLHDAPDPSRAVRGGRAWCGVLHAGGVSTFRDAQIKLLTSKSVQ